MTERPPEPPPEAAEDRTGTTVWPDVSNTQVPGQPVLSCLVVLGACVLVVALVVVGLRVHRATQARERTASAQARVDEAYATVRPAADERRRTGQEALSTVLGPAVLQSSVLECSLEEDYAGFNVEGWHERCVLRTVDAYRSDGPAPVLAAKLARVSSSDGPLVQLGARTSTPLTKGCGIVREGVNEPGGPDTWAVLVSRLPAGGFDALDVDGARSTCHPPRQAYDVRQNRVEQAYDPAALSAEHTWVTVERTEPIVTLDLGCARVLSCDLPIADIVMPRS